MGRKRVYRINGNICNLRMKSGWRIGDCQFCCKKNIRSNKWDDHLHQDDLPKILNPKEVADINKTTIQNAATIVRAIIFNAGLKFLHNRFPLGISEEDQKTYLANLCGDLLHSITNDPQLPVNHRGSTINSRFSQYMDDSLLERSQSQI